MKTAKMILGPMASVVFLALVWYLAFGRDPGHVEPARQYKQTKGRERRSYEMSITVPECDRVLSAYVDPRTPNTIEFTCWVESKP